MRLRARSRAVVRWARAVSTWMSRSSLLRNIGALDRAFAMLCDLPGTFSRVCEVCQVLVESADQWPVVCGHGEVGKTLEEELTLLYRPDDCQALQLDGGVALLGGGE